MAQNGSTPMARVEQYFDEMDSARIFRIRELSEINRLFGGSDDSDRLGLRSKALVVLTYAMWEGFYNECVEIYCRFLSDEGKKITDVAWNMLVGALSSDFERLRARNFSRIGQQKFVESLRERLSSDFENYDASVVRTGSNLDFKRLNQNFQVLEFDIAPIQRHRIKIDKELVGWRHGIAHGDSPELTSMNSTRHVALVEEIMALVADAFQEAILRQR